MTRYQRFFASGRKAGKSPQQIGHEWRSHAPAGKKAHHNGPASRPASRATPAGKKAKANRHAGRPANRAMRNPPGIVDRPPGIVDRLQGGFSQAVSVDTAKVGLAVLGGAAVATGAPTLAGSWNQGWLGLGLSLVSAAIAGVATAAVAPALAAHVAAGGITVVGLRLVAQFVPRALHWAAPKAAAVAGFVEAPRTTMTARPASVAGYVSAPPAPARVAGYLPPAAVSGRLSGHGAREEFKTKRF